MKIYVTKYALTKGILEEEAEPVANVETMVKVFKSGYIPSYYHSGEWFLNRKEAIDKANNMRLKKIDSLKRKIKELQQPIN